MQTFTGEEFTCVQITYRKGVQKGFIGKERTQGADIVQGKWGREGAEPTKRQHFREAHCLTSGASCWGSRYLLRKAG